MDTLEICYMSAGDLSKLVENKEVSPVEIIDAHLARIDATEPVLNSFITLLADESRAAARQSRAYRWRMWRRRPPIGQVLRVDRLEGCCPGVAVFDRAASAAPGGPDNFGGCDGRGVGRRRFRFPEDGMGHP